MSVVQNTELTANDSLTPQVDPKYGRRGVIVLR